MQMVTDEIHSQSKNGANFIFAVTLANLGPFSAVDVGIKPTSSPHTCLAKLEYSAAVHIYLHQVVQIKWFQII